MGILEFFDQYKCTKNEKEHLLDYLCTIRVKRVIKEINDLKINKKTENISMLIIVLCTLLLLVFFLKIQ